MKLITLLIAGYVGLNSLGPDVIGALKANASQALSEDVVKPLADKAVQGISDTVRDGADQLKARIAEAADKARGDRPARAARQVAAEPVFVPAARPTFQPAPASFTSRDTSQIVRVESLPELRWSDE